MNEKQQEYLQLFGDVFAGRFDCYAEAFPHPTKPHKVSYALKKEPLTQSVLWDHVQGNRRVGIYPLVDNYVRWFAIDFDAPTGLVADMQADLDGTRELTDDEIFALAWEEAKRQAEVLEQAGLFVYLEKSRSGKGVHLWGFFDEALDARLVLTAIKPLLLDAESYDRMYPVQAQVDKGGYGNLIALPFHGGSLKEGKSAFLNPDTLEVIDPLEFLRSVQFNNRYVVEELAEKAPKETKSLQASAGTSEEWEFSPDFSGRPERPQRGFLKMISSYGCKFMHHAAKDAEKISQSEWWVAVGQTTCFAHGRDAAHLISALDKKRYDPKETDALYDRLMQQTPHGCAYIHANFPKYACSECPMKAPYHIAKKPILELARETKAPLAKQNWQGAVARIKRRVKHNEKPGVPWYTAGLDKYSRIRQGEFIIVGARPSVGKTALMVDTVYNLASNGVPVLVFSAETGEEPLQDRLLARATEIDSKMLRNEGHFPLSNHELDRLEAAAEHLSTLPLYINYGATRPDQILDLIEETLLTNRIPLDQPYVVFMDYIQFGNATDNTAGQTEYARLTKVSQEFKYIAKILYQAFIAYAQLKRESEGETGAAISEIKGTGQFEQDADQIMALTGDRIPGPQAPRKLLLLKQKEGDAGVEIPLLLHQTYCYFRPLDVEDFSSVKDDMFAGEPDPLAKA